MRDLFEIYVYTSITTEEFQQFLETKSGMDLSIDFDQFIYGVRVADDPGVG